tara:strand:- start:2453 stop:3073 length:621 start_codon:yes stop_codon:yes gene_type:complete
MNVNKFLSEIGKSGIAYQNRYDILFGATRNGKQLFDRGMIEKMNTRLESVALPASGIASSPVKLQGIDREMPYGRIYEGDITLVFLEDSNFTIRKAFEAWQNKVIDETTYLCGFYDEYTCERLDITMSNLKSKEVYKVRVFDLFPKTVNAVQLTAAGEELVKTEVAISYRRWTSNPEEGSSESEEQIADSGPNNPPRPPRIVGFAG